MYRKMFAMLWVCLIAVVIACTADREIPVDTQAGSPAVGTSGMVSTAYPLATQSGLEILKAGGNAFDAAVAVAAVLNVVWPPGRFPPLLQLPGHIRCPSRIRRP